MITVEKLNRNYGELKAVDNVSFQIKKGEVVGLLGHNGAGKTSIMKMLTGFLEPSSGEILINNLNVRDERAGVQELIGYLPENCPTYPDMTVASYLEYIGQLKKIPDSQCLEHIRMALIKTGLLDKALSPIHTLSRGYRQRVGVAQAILGQPEILILDEPTNGLDPQQIIHMRNLIKKLAQKCTVIISTHILQEVEAMCDRVLIIRNGKLAIDSKLSDLQSSRKIVFTTNGEPDKIANFCKDINSIAPIKHIGQADHEYQYNIDVPNHTTSQAISAQLSKTLVEHGFEIYSIHPEKRDLEMIFKEINISPEMSKEGVQHAA